MILASASGTPVAAIARLVAADEDTVREVIHAFNAKGLAALDPQWAGGRPRLISDDDTGFIVLTATTRPGALGIPFTHWSVRKLVAYLARDADRRIVIGRERLRLILREHHISFQRTRTWKESTDPDKDAKLDRIDYVTSHSRCAASRSTSSGRSRSGPATAPPGRRSPSPSGYERRITARTAFATSTAATASATTNCGVSPGAAKVGTTHCLRSSRSERPAPTAHPST
jgi:transposase